MIEQVISRSQLLSVLVERRPDIPDSISDFGRLLLLESNYLAQVFRAFSSCQYLHFMSSISISFLVSEVWLPRIQHSTHTRNTHNRLHHTVTVHPRT